MSGHVTILARRIDRAIGRVSLSVYIFSAVWMGLLAFLILADVIGRTFFSQSVVGTPEIVAHSVVVIAFLQISRAVREGTMLRADFIKGFAPARFLKLSGKLNAALGTFAFTVLVWGSYLALVRAYHDGEVFGDGSISVSTVPVRAIMTLGCLLGAVEYFLNFMRTFMADIPAPIEVRK